MIFFLVLGLGLVSRISLCLRYASPLDFLQTLSKMIVRENISVSY